MPQQKNLILLRVNQDATTNKLEFTKSEPRCHVNLNLPRVSQDAILTMLLVKMYMIEKNSIHPIRMQFPLNIVM